MGKIEEFLIGKKVESDLVTSCHIDFKDTNFLNPFSMFQQGGKGVIKCEFLSNEEPLGHVNFYFNVTKNGISLRTDTSKGVIGNLARESDIINNALDI